jgi:hypothetical protein
MGADLNLRADTWVGISTRYTTSDVALQGYNSLET